MRLDSSARHAEDSATIILVFRLLAISSTVTAMFRSTDRTVLRTRNRRLSPRLAKNIKQKNRNIDTHDHKRNEGILVCI